MSCLFGIVMLTACSSEEAELSLTASLGTTYLVSSSEPAGCDFSTKTFTTTPTV